MGQPFPKRVGRILIADDVRAQVEFLAGLLEQDGHTVFRARDGSEALEIASRQQPDVVLLDVMMPHQTGFEVCRALKSDPATRLIPVVLVTSLQGSSDRIRGLEAGADDFLSKPVNAHEFLARVRSLLRIKRFTDDLESAESVILSLALTIEARDTYTDGHCHRLAAYAAALGEALHLDEEEVEALRQGGVLHDLGKIGVPDSTLLKAGALTRSEFETVKQHPVVGDRLCGPLRSLKRVRPIVRHHHEHFDGSGYPDGLRGDDIPLLAQIMGIVDVFGALTTERPYKPAESVDVACRALEDELAAGWRRADLVETFVGLVRDGRMPISEQKM